MNDAADADIDAMELPELLLPRLNDALRELYGAIDLLGDQELADQLAPVMRRLLLAELLGKESILAIGGSQGAGKTTIVRAIYELAGSDAEWLPANEGRGEKIPVLVLEEAGRTTVEGAVRCLKINNRNSRYEVQEITLTVEEFQRAVKEPDPTHLLPVLKVPRRYFLRSDQAWLLLPGYEKEDRQNQDWQRLMRQALVGAAGCVIVTDETRMANQQQQEIVRDMLSNELRGTQTVVVITKTEAIRGDSERQQALRGTARDVFELPAGCADRWIVCTGSDDREYVSEWLPAFTDVAKDLALSGGSGRTAKLTRLESVLRRDLTAVITRTQTKAKLFFYSRDGGDDGTREVVGACLAAFDDECAVVREQYQRNVGKGLDEILGGASKDMRRRLRDNHESVWNHLRDYFRTATESLGQIERDISEAWQAGGSVLDAHAVAIGKITAPKLGAPREMQAVCAPPERQAPPTSTRQRLGYFDKDEAVPWSRPSNEDWNNLRVLLAAQAKDSSASSVLNKGFEQSIALLPALVLEYARVASILPAIVGVSGETANPNVALQKLDVGQALGQLGEGARLGQTVLRSIAAVLALDLAVDGEVDIVDIFGKVLTGGAGSAASAAITGVGAAVIGVVSVAYLAHSAMRQVRIQDTEAIHVAGSMLRNIRDRHLVHFMSHYDEIMESFRARLRQAFRSRYHLDEHLMQQDRLAKALADVRSLQSDLLHQLGRTGRSLSLFNPQMPDT